MQPQDPRRNPSLLSDLAGLAQPAQQQPVQQPPQQPQQAPVALPVTQTDQDANLVPDELTNELQQVEQQYLYHATPTEYVDKIKESGLIPMASPSNWVKAEGEKRYGNGEIYTFDNEADAVKWAAKMDWEFNKELGSGKVSLIRLKKSGDWVVDTNDPLSQAGSYGQWLKREQAVNPEDIDKVIPLTQDITQKLIGTEKPELNDLFNDQAQQPVEPEQNQQAEQDYFMSHRPTENGPRAYDLTEIRPDMDSNVPADMYEQWYGSRGSQEDKESIEALKQIKGNPEAEVTIYRAGPKNELNAGDWVTLSKSYAEMSAREEDTPINEFKVKAKDLRWPMDDVNEFGYYPEQAQQPVEPQSTFEPGQPIYSETGENLIGRVLSTPGTFSKPYDKIEDIRNNNYAKEKITLEELLNNNPQVEKFLEEHLNDPKLKDVSYAEYNVEPIVDANGKLLDGEKQILEAIRNGETELEIYKAINPNQPALFKNPLRGTRKYSEEDIADQKPDIQLKRDVTVRDIYGEKVQLQEGESITPYQMEDGKVVIQDGVAATVMPKVLEEVERNSLSSEYQTPFMRDNALDNREVTVIDENSDFDTDDDWDSFVSANADEGIEVRRYEDEPDIVYYRMEADPPEQEVYYKKDEDGDWVQIDEEEFYELDKEEDAPEIKIEYETPTWEEYGYPGADEWESDTSHLPDYVSPPDPDDYSINRNPNSLEYEDASYVESGDYDNYKETVVNRYDSPYSIEETEMYKKLEQKAERKGWDYYDPEYIRERDKIDNYLAEKYGETSSFVSTHFGRTGKSENLEFHIRSSNRIWAKKDGDNYDRKKVYFLEEAQSDWARQARSNGLKGEKASPRPTADNPYPNMKKPFESQKEQRNLQKVKKKFEVINEKFNEYNKNNKQITDNLRKLYNPSEQVMTELRISNRKKYNEYQDIFQFIYTPANPIATYNYLKEHKLNNKYLDSYYKKLIPLKNKYDKDLKKVEEAREEVDKYNNKKPYNPNLKYWLEDSLKMALQQAVDDGADVFAWTNGYQQGRRYGLSRAVDTIEKMSIKKFVETNGQYSPSEESFYRLQPELKNSFVLQMTGTDGNLYRFFVDKNTEEILKVDNLDQFEDKIKGQPLASAIGADLTKQIMKAKSGKKFDTPEAIDVGNKSLANIYDVQIPDAIKKYTHQNVKSAPMGIGDGEEGVPTLDKYDRTQKSKTVKREINFSQIRKNDYISFDGGNYYITKKTPKEFKGINIQHLFARYFIKAQEYPILYGEKTIPKIEDSWGGGIAEAYSRGKISPKKMDEYVTTALQFLSKGNDSISQATAFKNIPEPQKTEMFNREKQLWTQTVRKSQIPQPQVQQYIELTPVVKALIKGEKLPIRASRRKY